MTCMYAQKRRCESCGCVWLGIWRGLGEILGTVVLWISGEYECGKGEEVG
jgi:hypothetical protein